MSIDIENFSEAYKKLSERDRTTFARICNKLLSENFIY